MNRTLVARLIHAAMDRISHRGGRRQRSRRGNTAWDTNNDPNIKSLSTLQVLGRSYDDTDLLFRQTRIRLCAHIAEKDIAISPKTPMYRSFARELEARLCVYDGPSTTTIEWAKIVLRRYADKYGL